MLDLYEFMLTFKDEIENDFYYAYERNIKKVPL